MPDLAWSGITWLVSVAAVAVSGLVAAMEGTWRRGRHLHIGFATHGGMWGDAVLLPIVNALIVPWIQPGAWLVGALLVGAAASLVLHRWWHGGQAEGIREHMWPSRPSGHWHTDLSWAGWCHVAYVALEMALLAAYVATPVPAPVVWVVSGVLTLHVPLGVLAPPWLATRRVFRADLWQTALAIAAIWAVAGVKVLGSWGLGVLRS